MKLNLIFWWIVALLVGMILLFRNHTRKLPESKTDEFINDLLVVSSFILTLVIAVWISYYLLFG